MGTAMAKRCLGGERADHIGRYLELGGDDSDGHAILKGGVDYRLPEVKPRLEQVTECVIRRSALSNRRDQVEGLGEVCAGADPSQALDEHSVQVVQLATCLTNGREHALHSHLEVAGAGCRVDVGITVRRLVG